MYWLVQSNSFSEPGYQFLLESLIRMDIPHMIVKVIPFSHDREPVPDVHNPICVMGSTTLVRIAKKYGWGPGVFWDENLTFDKWRAHWGEHLLNFDSYICRFADVKFDGAKFLRPVDDLKSFAGGVVYSDRFEEWQEKVLRYNDGTVNSETLVTVASVKDIQAEYRFFVIDGKVITGSRYKLGDRVTSSDQVDQYIWDYAQARVDEWQPDRGFVIDIAITPKGLRIIEVNNLNSSGLYHCDVTKIIHAIEQLA